MVIRQAPVASLATFTKGRVFFFNYLYKSYNDLQDWLGLVQSGTAVVRKLNL